MFDAWMRSMHGRLPASTLSGIAHDWRMNAESLALAVCSAFVAAAGGGEGRHAASSTIVKNPVRMRIKFLVKSGRALSARRYDLGPRTKRTAMAESSRHRKQPMNGLRNSPRRPNRPANHHPDKRSQRRADDISHRVVFVRAVRSRGYDDDANSCADAGADQDAMCKASPVDRIWGEQRRWIDSTA
jgi:hypothetical protein